MNRDRDATIPQSAVSATDTIGLWPSECGHLIQDVAREQRLGDLSTCTPCSKRLADDRLVPEEGVLRTRLPMVPRHLPPPTPSDLRDLPDRAIASARTRSSARHLRRPRRWHHDGRASVAGGLVQGDRVVGRVPGDAGEATVDGFEQFEGGRRVSDRRLGQRVGPDRSRCIDTEMKLFSTRACRGPRVSLRPIPLRRPSRGPCCR